MGLRWQCTAKLRCESTPALAQDAMAVLSSGWLHVQVVAGHWGPPANCIIMHWHAGHCIMDEWPRVCRWFLLRNCLICLPPEFFPLHCWFQYGHDVCSCSFCQWQHVAALLCSMTVIGPWWFSCAVAHHSETLHALLCMIRTRAACQVGISYGMSGHL
jgi:hypothetical protein